MGKKNLENGETENASDGSVRKMQRIDKFPIKYISIKLFNNYHFNNQTSMS